MHLLKPQVKLRQIKSATSNGGRNKHVQTCLIIVAAETREMLRDSSSLGTNHYFFRCLYATGSDALHCTW